MVNLPSKLFVGVVLCAVFLFSAIAPAIIVDRGDYTQDSRTGLAFLDLTESLNRSVQQVETQLGTFGDFAGHRYATVDEVLSLFRNAGITSPFGTSRVAGTDAELAAIGDLQQLIGITNTFNTGVGFEGRVSSGSTNEPVTGAPNLRRSPFLEIIDWFDPTRNDLVSVSSSGPQFDSSSPGSGHWLVLNATPLGYREDAPILPTTTVGPQKNFNNVDGRGAWYDPVASDSYEFVITDGTSLFTAVGLPANSSDSDQMFTLSFDGEPGITLEAGVDYVFDTPVDSFTISGIELLDDAETFSAFLMFDQEQVSFSMIDLSEIPEPAAGLLLLVGGGMIAVRRRRIARRD